MSKVMPPTPTPVLVVDDDAEMRTALSDVLTMAGYRVQTAESGTQALAQLRAEPDGQVVVLDYQMPDMTGEAVLLAVLAEPTLARRLTFVVVTATVKLLASFVTFLSGRHMPLVRKPFDVDQLLASVDEAAVCIEALMMGTAGAGASGGTNDTDGADGADGADG